MAGRSTGKEEDDILGRILEFSALHAAAPASASASVSSATAAATAAAAAKAPSKQEAGQGSGSGSVGAGSGDAGLAPLLLKAKLKRKLDEFHTDGICVGGLGLLNLEATVRNGGGAAGKAPRAEGRDSPGGGSSNTKGSVHDEAFLAGPHVPAVSTEAQGPPAVAEGKADAAPAPAPTVGSGRRAV